MKQQERLLNTGMGRRREKTQHFWFTDGIQSLKKKQLLEAAAPYFQTYQELRIFRVLLEVSRGGGEAGVTSPQPPAWLWTPDCREEHGLRTTSVALLQVQEGRGKLILSPVADLVSRWGCKGPSLARRKVGTKGSVGPVSFRSQQT